MSNVYDSRYTAEVANLEKIASKLDTLLKGHKHIIASKGVNIDMAIALEEIYPGVVSTRTPVASFTGDISLTNYTVTTEAVSDVIKKVRDALVKAWKAVVQKITDWFNATFRNAKKNAQETKANFASMSQKYAGLKTIEDKLIPLFIEFTAKKSAEANDGKGPATPDDLIKAIHSSAFSILSRSVTKNIIALSRGKQWVGTVTAMGGARDIIADLDAKQKALVTAINKGEAIDFTQYSVSLTPISKLDTTGNGLTLNTGLETVSKLADIISKGSNIYFSSDEKLTLHDPVLAGLFNNTEGTFISVITGIEGILAGDISATLKEVNAGVLKLMSSVGSIDNIANSDALNPILETFRKTLAIVKRIIDTAEMMQRQLSEVSNTTHSALDAWGKQMLEMIANGGFSDDVTKGYKADIMAILKQNASTEDIDNEPCEYTTMLTESGQVMDENRKDSDEINALLQAPGSQTATGLEAITDHVKKVTDAIIKAIKAAYERIKNWLSNLFKKKPATAADAKEAGKKSKEANEEANKLDPFVKEGSSLLVDYFKLYPNKIPVELGQNPTAKDIAGWRWGLINRKVLSGMSPAVSNLYYSKTTVKAFIDDCEVVIVAFKAFNDIIAKLATGDAASISIPHPTAFLKESGITLEEYQPDSSDSPLLASEKQWSHYFKSLRHVLSYNGTGEDVAFSAGLNIGVFNFNLPAELEKGTVIGGNLMHGMAVLNAIGRKAEGGSDNDELVRTANTCSSLVSTILSCAANLSGIVSSIIDTKSAKYVKCEKHFMSSFYMVIYGAEAVLGVEENKTQEITALLAKFSDLKKRMAPVYEKLSTESVEVMVDENGEELLDGTNELAGEEESAGELDKIVGLQATMEELGLGSAGHVASDVALHQLREKAVTRNHLKTVSKIDSLLSA